MDSMGFQIVKVATVVQRDLSLLAVTIKMDTATASQTLLAISVNIVRRDFLDSHIVKRTPLWPKF